MNTIFLIIEIYKIIKLIEYHFILFLQLLLYYYYLLLLYDTVIIIILYNETLKRQVLLLWSERYIYFFNHIFVNSYRDTHTHTHKIL